MTHRIIKYVFFILFIVSINAQNIESVDISGNHKFSKSDYLDWISINPQTPVFNELKDTIANRVNLNLNNNGYFNSKITAINSTLSNDSTLKINVIVEEGEPTYVNMVNFFNANFSDSLIIQSKFNFIKGKIFNKYELERAVFNILNEYENIGFPFTKIVINSIVPYQDSTKYYADINLTIDKGEKSTIDKIEIIGNEKTKDEVIVRAARVSPSTTYSQEKVEAIPKKLNRLRFFQPVRTPSFYFNSKNEGVLKITVQEKQVNNFDGIAGYVPGDENNDGYFTGFLNINLRNLFGTGRAAAFRWFKENQNTQELEIKYLEPWMFDYPFNVGVNFYQRKQDTTYVQNKFEGSIDFLASDDISASLILSTESIIPTENDNNIFSVYNSNIFSTGIKLTIDNRDDVYAPTEGVYFINSYYYSSKKINGPAEFITSDTKTKVDLKRLELDLSYFYELFRRNIVAAGVHAREMRGDFFETSDYYKLGGTSTLRGYRENQFLANRIFWSNLEYRYLLSPRTFAFLFFDTGYYLRNEDLSRSVMEISDFKYGYGFGLNLETTLGVLGVSFALGEGDSFSQGKIHFAIINEF